MKKYKHYITVFLLLFALGSCSDILEITPEDELITDQVLSTLDGLEGSIWGIYERGRNPYESNDVSTWKIVGTDLVEAGSNLADQAVVQALNNYNFQLNPRNQGVIDLWNSHYIGLNRANIILKNVEIVPINQESSEDIRRRDKIMGIAYYFRAYFHLSLVQRWDNIVLVTDAPEVIQFEQVLSPKDAVYDQVEADLLAAIDLLPETTDAEGNGSVSKGVARHLLSLAYLDMGEYANAAKMASLVINDPAYSLQPLDVIFSENSQENSEIIFAWQFTSLDVNRPSRTVQQMIPLYDRINGVMRTFDYGGRPWARLYPSDYLMNLYEPDDARLDAWYVTEYLFNDPDNLPEGKSIGDVVTEQDVLAQGQDVRHIRPTTKKYWETDALGRALGDAQGYKNVIEFRLAQSYLVAAEAVLKDPGASGQLAGEVAGFLGVDLVNVLRERANVEPYTTLNQELFLEEHARELAHEGHRWNLLKRFGVLIERVDEYNDPGAAGNIQPYHTAWPIPESFVQQTGVEQNPGYN